MGTEIVIDVDDLARVIGADILRMEEHLRARKALLDPKTGKPTRVGFKILADGKKVRVAKASGEVIEG